MILEFEFPAPTAPWSTNQDRNLNPYVRAERISEWKRSARLLFRQEVTRRRLALPLEPAIVQIRIPFKQVRRRDPHNYCGTVLKAIIDGLVKGGAWQDDTPEWVGHREPILYKGDMVDVVLWEMPQP